jgi:hypothetical protein
MKNETVLGYLAISSDETLPGEFNRKTPYVRVISLNARSFVGERVIPTETFIGEGEVVSVTSAPQANPGVTPEIADGDSLKLSVIPVGALGVAVQKGRVLLLDIVDQNAQSLSLKDYFGEPKKRVKASFVGVIPVSGVYRITARDGQTGAHHNLGLQFGDTIPDDFVSRVNQSGVEEFSEWNGWESVALLRRAQFQAAQKEESVLDEIKFTERGEPIDTDAMREEKRKFAKQRLEALKVPEPEEDILIPTSDVDLVERASDIAPLNFVVRGGHYCIARTSAALAAIQQARRELKNESETVAQED